MISINNCAIFNVQDYKLLWQIVMLSKSFFFFFALMACLEPASEIHEEEGLLSTGTVYMGCILSLMKTKIVEWTIEVSVRIVSSCIRRFVCLLFFFFVTCVNVSQLNIQSP